MKEFARDDAFEAKLAALDLEPIIFKITSADGPGWTLATADAIAIHYRRFLALNYYFPQESNVTNKTVDEFWHAHILDTGPFRGRRPLHHPRRLYRRPPGRLRPRLRA